MKQIFIFLIFLIFTQTLFAFPKYTCLDALKDNNQSIELYKCDSLYNKMALVYLTKYSVCFENPPFHQPGEVLALGVSESGHTGCADAVCGINDIALVKDSSGSLTMVFANSASFHYSSWDYISCKKL